jgi:two-component system, NarL family, invasion response regulator UvrY
LARGKSTREIADELSLSVKTVSTYRTRILDKLAVKNSAEIVRYAIEHRIVDL